MTILTSKGFKSQMQWQLTVVCFLLFCLCLFVDNAEARASSESEVVCSPVEIEPLQKSYCVIHARDLQQEPTMSFNVEEFSITAYSSVPAAALKVTPLRRGDDVTTVVFEISASEGTSITVSAMYTSATQNDPIRKSGLVIAVLSWPAVRMGPIYCNVPITGLVLRSTITCTAPLYDAGDRHAVAHENDVSFTEGEKMGNFGFVSGKRNLTFTFTATSTSETIKSEFTLHVTLLSSSNIYSVTFPLVYPTLYPEAAASLLICSNESMPMVCTLRSSDSVGPVRLNLDHFRIIINKLESDTGTNKWVDNTNNFEITSRVLTQADTAVISWKLKLNNAINTERLHVYIVEQSGMTRLREIHGSPFVFSSGIVPNAAYVSLRGCRVAAIGSGNYTTCFIDLQHGITGDPRFFNLDSILGGTFLNLTYLPSDPIFRAPALSFIYKAPRVEIRTDDFITLLVGGQSAARSPFRLSVFPPRQDVYGANKEVSNSHNAIVIGVGLFFYGIVLGGGAFVVFQRNRRFNRIRCERELRMAKDGEMEASKDANGQTSIHPVPQNHIAVDYESD